MDAAIPVFEFEQTPVGYLLGLADGVSPGEHDYMPFRGPGHFSLQNALKTGDAARCTCVHDGRAVSFDVVSCPRYGVLTIRNVVDERAQAAE